MKFAIATPTRNRLPDLKRCVGSVRGQAHSAVTHIVQDCLSTDGTAGWLSEQADLLWASEADSGMYDAIARAWSRADGDVLSWLNSDEQYLPGTLQAVEDAFARHPECDVVWGNVIVVNELGAPVAARREIPLRAVYLRNGFLYAYSCATFFRRKLYDEGLLELDPVYRYAADLDLYLKLLNTKVRFHHLSAYVALFGISGSNLSRHPGMIAETEAIRMKYRCLPSAALRRGVLLGRSVERAFAGAYIRTDLTYSFATDERPLYQQMQGKAIGGRYALR